MLTDAQLRKILEMQDITGPEQQFAYQQMLAQQLRGQGGGVTPRTDVGSNLGRAFYGAAGALGDVQAAQALKQANQRRAEFIRNLRTPYQSETGLTEPPND